MVNPSLQRSLISLWTGQLSAPAWAQHFLPVNAAEQIESPGAPWGEESERSELQTLPPEGSPGGAREVRLCLLGALGLQGWAGCP